MVDLHYHLAKGDHRRLQRPLIDLYKFSGDILCLLTKLGAPLGAAFNEGVFLRFPVNTLEALND